MTAPHANLVRKMAARLAPTVDMNLPALVERAFAQGGEGDGDSGNRDSSNLDLERDAHLLRHRLQRGFRHLHRLHARQHLQRRRSVGRHDPRGGLSRHRGLLRRGRVSQRRGGHLPAGELRQLQTALAAGS